MDTPDWDTDPTDMPLPVPMLPMELTAMVATPTTLLARGPLMPSLRLMLMLTMVDTTVLEPTDTPDLELTDTLDLDTDPTDMLLLSPPPMELTAMVLTPTMPLARGPLMLMLMPMPTTEDTTDMLPVPTLMDMLPDLMPTLLTLMEDMLDTDPTDSTTKLPTSSTPQSSAFKQSHHSKIDLKFPFK